MSPWLLLFIFLTVCWNDAELCGADRHIVVAKDGSGNFTTIGEAIAAAPIQSKDIISIMIREGVYDEYIVIGKEKINIMFIGDGMYKTIVSGNRSVHDGIGTDKTATVDILGDGFIAKEMTFQNTAGREKEQAVALKSDAQSAFYKCRFLGFQDTLYAKSKRQFYRDCEIHGTVDFIFGDASAVFQKCLIFARKPLNGQNIITAQGRESPESKGGIILHNCTIKAAADLIPYKSSTKTYLGRPWKTLYSRVVVMESYIEDLIDPRGWIEWNKNLTNLDKLFYAEYQNQGPGANTTNRVKWPGYKVLKIPSEVSQFTVKNFIKGNEWIPWTGIPFISGLL
ncbi:pectinesterase-like [Impatiens glandulifera]|uniref:pectinesterase-like n=1 Tax=Impatiens glandulifera TaxID=253017 RepID=UPI001FB07CCB|nr:pectinesterase-like [Impatiens glandulifera]